MPYVEYLFPVTQGDHPHFLFNGLARYGFSYIGEMPGNEVRPLQLAAQEVCDGKFHRAVEGRVIRIH
jgi:hypothetical protein